MSANSITSLEYKTVANTGEMIQPGNGVTVCFQRVIAGRSSNAF